MIEAIYAGLIKSWDEVLTSVRAFKVNPPDLKAMINEAQFVAEHWDTTGQSYVRDFLRQRDWGRIEAWTELARRVFATFHALYLIPFRENKLPSPTKLAQEILADAPFAVAIQATTVYYRH